MPRGAAAAARDAFVASVGAAASAGNLTRTFADAPGAWATLDEYRSLAAIAATTVGANATETSPSAGGERPNWRTRHGRLPKDLASRALILAVLLGLAGGAARAGHIAATRAVGPGSDYRADGRVEPRPVRPYREVQFSWENDRP